MRKFIIAGCVLAMLATTLPALASARDLYVGINANTREWGDPGEEQDNVSPTGATRLREDIYWWRVEPTNDGWDWDETDELFEDAATRGMSILPVLDEPPCWAVPGDTDPELCEVTYPVSDAEFAEYTSEVVERYGPEGTFWNEHEFDDDLAPRWFEIWNEPYYPWATNEQVDPARYAALYKPAVIAGRLKNPATRYLYESTVDVANPNGPGWVNWAEASVEADGTIGSYIDGIAIHPYPGHNDPDYLPENGTDESFKNTDVIFEDWADEGIRRPIWITEVGYSSCDDEADRCVPGDTQEEREDQKAEWLMDLFDQLGEDPYGYVHAVYLYNLRQWGEEPENFDVWFGILDDEALPLPAWFSFESAVDQYDGVPVPNTIITELSTGSESATIGFGVTDPTSSFECQLDAAGYSPCTSPKAYRGLARGSHTFRVRATNAEATESGPASTSWRN